MIALFSHYLEKQFTGPFDLLDDSVHIRCLIFLTNYMHILPLVLLMRHLFISFLDHLSSLEYLYFLTIQLAKIHNLGAVVLFSLKLKKKNFLPFNSSGLIALWLVSFKKNWSYIFI